MKYTVIVNCIPHCISTALLNNVMHDHEDSVKHATTGPAPRPTPYKPRGFCYFYFMKGDVYLEVIFIWKWAILPIVGNLHASRYLHGHALSNLVMQ